ncbi:MAG: DUF1587 domain-containing protein [Deltaproteobacteria bacterium]|nr:DUF1587 domain-containing protein [Deltaproteobacteria bacterium]
MGAKDDDPTTEAEICEAPSSPPRQLRLLTRREYNRSVEDLFGDGSGASCDDDADCDITTESCSGGACLADPCTLHTFVFDPNGASVGRVHVAGSFNGWPGTEAAGGWPMEYIAELDLWVTKRALDEGQHQYKFVVDESTWMHDTANGVTVDDGYGGYNSVLNLECGEAEQVAADFPSETRPKGFGYDNHAASAIVSSTHVEMYLRAAEALSERACGISSRCCPATQTRLGRRSASPCSSKTLAAAPGDARSPPPRPSACSPGPWPSPASTTAWPW